MSASRSNYSDDQVSGIRTD